MEKDQGHAAATAPLPSAPPSYEEAVANSGPPRSSVPNPPYPIAGVTMPMPTPYTQATASMPMPTPGPPGQSAPSTLPPSYSAPQHNFVPPAPQDIRVLHQHVGFSLGPNPEKMTCPTCRANIKTTTVSDHQPSAHICCIILCILGCCLCSCLPYCMNSFMSVHHFCPNCKTYIGTWKG